MPKKFEIIEYLSSSNKPINNKKLLKRNNKN